jgi:hypothetical protein
LSVMGVTPEVNQPPAQFMSAATLLSYFFMGTSTVVIVADEVLVVAERRA